MTRTVLIVGATSDIARATARAFAAKGCVLQLAARDVAALAADAEDLRVRSGERVDTLPLDILDDPAGFAARLEPLPDIAVCMVGLLGDQAGSEQDPVAAERVIRTNFTGPALMMGALAERFAARGSGSLVGVSSVAGDRGRATNYVYGSAKAGFTAFLSGLRNRLHGHGVHVVTVKPGFVDTRMTAGMRLPKALTAHPDDVAAAITAACDTRRNTVYVRPVWRLVMAVIRAIPEPVFKRLRL